MRSRVDLPWRDPEYFRLPTRDVTERMEADGFEKFGLAIGIAVAVLFLFAPLAMVFFYDLSAMQSQSPGAAEATVGVAVIVRAAARRVLTTTVSNLLRTAFATFSRTAARTVMRRLMRFVVRALFGVLTREATWEMSSASASKSPIGSEQRTPAIPLTVGIIGLSLSFLGVVLVTDTLDVVTMGGSVSIFSACIFASLPLLVYGMIHIHAARRLGVTLRFNTAFDGLLLQAYFTGAGSFLPMTTDIEYAGSQRAKMWLATICLGSLFSLHLILFVIAAVLSSDLIHFASGTFLIFCFVYVFPIKPLEGYDIWAESKVLWVAVWLVVLTSFFFTLPASLSDVL